MKTIGLLIAGVSLAIAHIHAADAAENSVLKRGQMVVEKAFKELSGNLQKAIANGGFTNAIAYCSEQAIPLTLKIAREEGVRLRRVSHRPRNPANCANPHETALIQRFQNDLTAGAQLAPLVEKSAAGESVFYAPIVLNNPLCLNCHGDPKREIAPATLQAIASRYPADRATGFKMNELRGLWRIASGTEQSR